MTRGSKKDYIIAAEKLSVARASIGVNRWKVPPNNHLQDSTETPDSSPRFHLNNDAGKFE
jgi:hypothetical protein